MTPNSAVGNKAPQLVSPACVELTDRLWAGEDCRAEDFLGTEPNTDSDADAALELIYTEYVVREELGQQPSPAVWFARFPQWRDRLERMLHIGALFDDVDELLAEDSLPDWLTVPESAADPSENLPATRDFGSAANGQTPPAKPDPWLDQYELLEKIGHGGMGVVYKARQLALNRIVALKAIRAGQTAAPDQRARFRREAENMARLRHPNIVPVYAVGERDGCPFFSMEFVEGGNLTHKIAGQPQPERDAARWVEVLARAVHYAHQQGLVHRDLKPSNVVLTTDGVPKITDFGLAKSLRVEPGVASNSEPEPVGPGGRPVSTAPESDTVTGTTIGTPAYMAPEQAAGNTREVGPLSDVYALGAILYELLTGRAPFSSKASQQTLEEVQEREPPPPRSFNPDVDPGLEAVCLRCLKKRPADRYPSAEALADDLARWLHGKRIRTRPLLPWYARLRHSVRRHPVVVGIFLLATIAAVVAPTVAYLRDMDRRLECIQRTLARGNPVTLVGDTGLPEWYCWRTTAGNPTISRASDGVVSIRTGRGYGLLELVSDPQQAHYRFSAEVRQDSSVGRSGEMGIYFAHSSYSGPTGPIQFFASLALNDNIGPFDATGPKEHGVMTRFHYLDEQKWDCRSKWRLGDSGLPIRFAPAVADERQGPWRKLAVEVTPERFHYSWEGQHVVSLPRDKVVQEYKTWMDEPGIPQEAVPQFRARGSLGLYVRQCTASFRRVLVEPLGNDE